MERCKDEMKFMGGSFPKFDAGKEKRKQWTTWLVFECFLRVWSKPLAAPFAYCRISYVI